MAVALRSTNAATADGTSVALSKPSGLADGDVVTISVACDRDDGAAATPVTGFTEIDDLLNTGGRTCGLWVGYKVITDASSEPASYTYNHSVAEDLSGVVCAWSGVNNSTPLDVTYSAGSHAQTGNDDPTPPNSSITTNTDGAFVVVNQSVTHASLTTVAPSGYTLANDANQENANCGVAYREIGTAGLESPGDWQNTGGDALAEWATLVFALNPDSTPEASTADMDGGFSGDADSHSLELVSTADGDFGGAGNVSSTVRIRTGAGESDGGFTGNADGEVTGVRTAATVDMDGGFTGNADGLLVARQEVTTATMDGGGILNVGITDVGFGLVWTVRTTASESSPTPQPAPTDGIIAASISSVTKIIRRIEILNDDETTYVYDAPSISGSVTVTMSSAERRAFECVLLPEVHTEDELGIGPGLLWYDKRVRIYRGVETATESHEALLGTFLIDKIERNHADSTIKLSGRDYTKLMLNSKLAFPTYFSGQEPIENIIQALALNAGVTKVAMPLTGDNTTVEHTISADTSRWDAAKDIADAFDWELYFDVEGTLVMEAYPDLDNDPVEHTFQTGAASNMSEYRKTVSDVRVKNHIVVVGQTGEDGQIPIVAEARNTNPSSPTRIAAIGERTDRIESAWVSDLAQAQALADRMLSIAALDSYEVPFGAIVTPWIDVGIVVRFVDPNPEAGDPDRFLLTEVTIPLQLEPMRGTMRRLVITS